MTRTDTANARKRDGNGIFQLSHGMSNTKVHRTWRAMLNRCQNKNGQDYENYMERGIKVCDRWQKFESFYEDMGLPPTVEHSIDRKNNDGDYELDNCRWATKKEQNNNKRDNKFVEWCGELISRQELALRIGINYRTLVTRLHRGWSIEQATSK